MLELGELQSKILATHEVCSFTKAAFDSIYFVRDLVENKKVFLFDFRSLEIFLIFLLSLLLAARNTHKVKSWIFLLNRSRKTLEKETNPHH